VRRGVADGGQGRLAVGALIARNARSRRADRCGGLSGTLRIHGTFHAGIGLRPDPADRLSGRELRADGVGARHAQVGSRIAKWLLGRRRTVGARGARSDGCAAGSCGAPRGTGSRPTRAVRRRAPRSLATLAPLPARSPGWTRSGIGLRPGGSAVHSSDSAFLPAILPAVWDDAATIPLRGGIDIADEPRRAV